MRLATGDHARASAGRTYVYAVLSRRAGGVSVGVNLNPNNACNWRCVYCQVPGLVQGKAPPIDLALLEAELRGLLTEIVQGDWLARNAPEGGRRLADVAFSGNGEPTSSPQFAPAVRLVGRILGELGPADGVKTVLITNGSLIQRPEVQAGLRALGPRGELWFKLDRATDEGMRAVNDASPGMERVRTNLRLACELAPTWIQTCFFARRGEPPGASEEDALVAFLAEHLAHAPHPRGVLLYGLARPSYQPEAPELGRLPESALRSFARRLEALGLEVRVHP